jgi:hypothetical protein
LGDHPLARKQGTFYLCSYRGDGTNSLVERVFPSLSFAVQIKRRAKWPNKKKIMILSINSRRRRISERVKQRLAIYEAMPRQTPFAKGSR